MEPFNNWKDYELKQLLLEYEITDKDIKGTGKNGRVLKIDISLPSDIINTILYNADINTIENLCVTNKSLAKLCQQGYFWKIIFDRDQLPLIDNPKSIQDYVDLYKKLTDIQLEIKGIFNVIHYYKINCFSMNTPVKNNNTNEIFDIKLNIKHLIMTVGIYNSKFNIDIFIGDGNPNHPKIFSLKLSETEFKIILCKLLYYYPNIGINMVIKTKKYWYGFPVNLRKQYLTTVKSTYNFHEQEVLKIFNS